MSRRGDGAPQGSAGGRVEPLMGLGRVYTGGAEWNGPLLGVRAGGS